MLTKRPHHKPLNRAIRDHGTDALCVCGHAASTHAKRKHTHRSIRAVTVPAGACESRIDCRVSQHPTGDISNGSKTCGCGAFRIASSGGRVQKLPWSPLRALHAKTVKLRKLLRRKARVAAAVRAKAAAAAKRG
jgi:hypothetical protein